MTLGLDHVDMRVPALGAVEKFYDAFAERLGLKTKRFAKVGFGGASWEDGSPEDYNAVEYYADGVPGRARRIFRIVVRHALAGAVNAAYRSAP